MVHQITSEDDFFPLLNENRVVAVIAHLPGQTIPLPYDEWENSLSFVKFAEVDIDKVEGSLGPFPIQPGCALFFRNGAPANPGIPAVPDAIEELAQQLA